MHDIVKEDMEYITSQQLPWSDFCGKTVLISGANGFLPAYMVETLLFLSEAYEGSDKIKVIGLVRNKDKAIAKFNDYINRPDFSLLVQDVTQPISIDGPVDYVIHAASQASPKFYGSDPVGTLSANVLGTHNLLELAKAKQVKGFLFFSSGEVYGEVSEECIPTCEQDYGYIDPVNVRSCYAESKRMGENMCVSWYHQFGVPVKIVRPFHTYGPGMSLDDGRVYADFVSDIVHGRNIVMKSSGEATRAFCYLADATLGFFTVLLRGKQGEAYNVGSDKEISILQVAKTLVSLYPEKGLELIQESRAETGGYIASKISRACPDISKSRSLGWEPKFSLEEGFKRTIRSCQ